ncbi:MAG: glycosyltransferase [Methylacidiphilales bacterium]|nr:glycosyltransferase [Candidatus Methylacidiphilales bacterium]
MRLLNLAPHCTVPPMDGADRRAWHLHESMVAQGVEGLFMGRNVVSRGGKLSSLPGNGPGWRDRKELVALAALLTGKNYWQFKMLTPAFIQAAAELRASDFQATIVHFLYSLPVIHMWRGEQMRLIIETHNYDPAIYDGLRNASRNPLLRHLCSQASKTSFARLQSLPKGTTLVHVSESDLAAYESKRPDLHHVVIENGCRVAPRTSAPDYAAPGEKQLLFVGSLSAQMNQDALFNFSRAYWPSLRGIARVRVVGSLPPSAVTELCAAQGWELCSNVTDAQLEGFYASAHYALAPFAYGAGSKLKLMEACGRGVPVIATRAGATGLATTPPAIHVTDEPKEWKRIVQGPPPAAQAIRETLDFAEQLSWPSLGAKLVKVVESSAVVTIP